MGSTCISSLEAMCQVNVVTDGSQVPNNVSSMHARDRVHIEVCSSQAFFFSVLARLFLQVTRQSVHSGVHSRVTIRILKHVEDSTRCSSCGDGGVQDFEHVSIDVRVGVPQSCLCWSWHVLKFVLGSSSQRVSPHSTPQFFTLVPTVESLF